MSIGSRLKDARIGQKLTQEELARAVGVTKGAIGNYETGVSSPKEPVLIKLMEVLNIDANYIYQDYMTMPENAREIFRINLARLMQEQHVEQADLVKAFGITVSTISDWVNGKKYPRVDKMQMLADYFNVPMSTLTSTVSAPATPNAAESELLSLYRSLNADGQSLVMITARTCAGNPAMQKDAAGASAM